MKVNDTYLWITGFPEQFLLFIILAFLHFLTFLLAKALQLQC